jgi:Na+-translocating ferredoxin:NAD+ oxidoreductase RnfD subunit
MKPARPAYWKALVITGSIAGVFCYVIHAVYSRIPVVMLLVVAALAALSTAQTIHRRVVDDWRADQKIDAAARRSNRGA